MTITARWAQDRNLTGCPAKPASSGVYENAHDVSTLILTKYDRQLAPSPRSYAKGFKRYDDFRRLFVAKGHEVSACVVHAIPCARSPVHPWRYGRLSINRSLATDKRGLRTVYLLTRRYRFDQWI